MSYIVLLAILKVIKKKFYKDNVLKLKNFSKSSLQIKLILCELLS